MGARHALFPRCWHLALDLLSREIGCQLPDANLLCKRSLRPLSRAGRPVHRSGDIGRGFCARLSATLAGAAPSDIATFRLQSSSIRGVYPRTAPACGRAFAPGYGSHLLTLRLLLSLQPGDPVFRPPEAGGFVRLCLPDPLPVSALLFRVLTGASGSSGEVVSPGAFQRAGPSSNRDLWSLGSLPWPKPVVLGSFTRITFGFYFGNKSRDRYPPRS